MGVMDWVKKLAGYAPEIATAIATGGASVAASAVSILGRELLGDSSATQAQVETAVKNASASDLLELKRADNEFRVQMAQIVAADAAAEHEETQKTIRAGDNSEDKFVRWTRPGQSWVSLFATFAYIFLTSDPGLEIIMALLALPWAYAGLRQVGKWKTATTLSKLSQK